MSVRLRLNALVAQYIVGAIEAALDLTIRERGAVIEATSKLTLRVVLVVGSRADLLTLRPHLNTGDLLLCRAELSTATCLSHFDYFYNYKNISLINF